MMQKELNQGKSFQIFFYLECDIQPKNSTCKMGMKVFRGGDPTTWLHMVHSESTGNAKLILLTHSSTT